MHTSLPNSEFTNIVIVRPNALGYRRYSPRAEGHLFAGNDQVFNWYFWKGPTLGYSKQDFLKWGSGGLRFY